MTLDTLRTAAGVPSKELRRVTFVRENIAGVDPGAGARAVCLSKKWAAAPCTKKRMLLGSRAVLRRRSVVPPTGTYKVYTWHVASETLLTVHTAACHSLLLL